MDGLAQCDYLKFQTAFRAVSGRGSSTVTAKDIDNIAAKIGYDIKTQKINEILTANDLEDTSPISLETFIKLIPRNKEHISEEEHRLAEVREKFSRYDVDGNGRISLQEAQWALQGELQVSPQTALRLLNQFVQLDYVQFVNFYQQVQKKKVEMFEKFGKFDTNMDGLISVEEAYAVLQKELGMDEIKSKAIVSKFDVNKDGSVSYVEFAEFYLAIEERKSQIRHSFKRFDSTDCGFVTKEQAEHILVDLLGFSKTKCKNAMDTYDKDGNGQIDYEEFVDFYAMVEEERQRLIMEFSQADSDGDGLISKQEFQALLKEKGFADTAVDTLMNGYDTDEDGFLNFDEFKKFLNFQ